MAAADTASGFLDALRAVRTESELEGIRKRIAPGDTAIGVRMKDLFDTAKAAQRMPLDQVEALFASDLYEARLGALCILDLRARARSATDADRRTYYEIYMRHLDRITTWDMVDRSAPSVVGGYLLGRSTEPLVELASAAQPLRRRTAITAPLWFIRYGGEDDLRAVSPSRPSSRRRHRPQARGRARSGFGRAFPGGARGTHAARRRAVGGGQALTGRSFPLRRLTRRAGPARLDLPRARRPRKWVARA